MAFRSTGTQKKKNSRRELLKKVEWRRISHFQENLNCNSSVIEKKQQILKKKQND